MKTANNEGKYCLIKDEFCVNHKLGVDPGIGLIFSCKKYKMNYKFNSFYPFTQAEKERAMQSLSKCKCKKED